MTTPARTTRTILALAAVAAGTLPGCARMRERWAARFEDPPEPARIIQPDTTPVGAEQGLEVIVWTADDTYFRVGRALDRHTTGEPVLPPDEAQAWQRAGLRVLAVPVDRLDALILDTPPLTPVQRQRYGQMPLWSPTVRGPQLPDGVTGPGGRRLEPGRPRLIVRSWIEPDLSSGHATDVVRTELAIQIESARRPGLLTDSTPGRSIADAGDIIDELIASVVSDGRLAFVIVAESPDIDWSALPEPPPPVTQSTPSVEPGTAVGPAPGADPPQNPPPKPAPGDPQAPAPTQPGPDGAQPGVPYGPATPRSRTLGEWMLSSPGIPARDGRRPIGPRKVLMVLVPRLGTPPDRDPTQPGPPDAPQPVSGPARTDPNTRADRSNRSTS